MKIDLVLKIFVSLVLLTNNACAMTFFKEKLPTTPISVPIDLTNKNSKIELEFRIKKKEKFGYDFHFSFDYKRRKKNLKEKIYEQMMYAEGFVYFLGIKSNFFKPKPIPKDELEDMWRVTKLAGGSVREDGKWVEYNGVSLLVDIQIMEITKNSQKIIFDKKIVPYGFNSFSKEIIDINLKPGIYKVVLTNLKEASELAETKVSFIIGENRSVDEQKIINPNY